jgi:hypothetical protein
MLQLIVPALVSRATIACAAAPYTSVTRARLCRRLTSEEISHALQSKRVEMTPEQVQVFIDAADADGNTTIEKNEFPDLIWHMATADLRRDIHAPAM